jgi:carbamoyltransferase
MNILGFNCYSHDAAATLLVDGKPVFAVEDERLSRKKHCGGFPDLSIRACLDSQGLKLSDIDHAAFSWKPSVSYPKVPVYFFRYLPKMISLWKESRHWSMEENLGAFNYWKRMRDLPKTLRALEPAGMPAHFKFHYLEHHLCHAASAFYPSGFDDAAILTVDGGGEWTTAQTAVGRGNRISKLAKVEIPHSLGAFYQAVSRYLGFDLISGPGKMMGLSAYGGKHAPTYDRMRKLIRLTDDGGFRLDLSYFAYHYTRRRGVSEKFEKEFGPAAVKGGEWQEHHYRVAAAAQLVTEDVVLHMANKLHARTGSDALCMAGGVALNSVANGRLIGETPFKKLFIQPAAGDSGTSLGAALWVEHAILNRKRSYVMTDAFLGPRYDDAAIRAELERSGLPHVKTENHIKIAAELLRQGKILGWFQGRMEFGPRALGNRSILANPCIADMKDVLNRRVKFREGFRPFAPIVLEERCGEYFDKDHPNPYMLLVYSVLPEKRSVIPAVTHVDGTGRIQTVSQSENPELWNLLTAFDQLTGVPVLINTSFNVKGEPIVCTPFDAVDSFRRADMDYLIIGPYVAAKSAADLDSALNAHAEPSPSHDTIK